MSKYKLCEGCDTRMPKDFNYPVFCGRCLDDIQEQGRSSFRAEVEKVLREVYLDSERNIETGAKGGFVDYCRGWIQACHEISEKLNLNLTENGRSE